MTHFTATKSIIINTAPAKVWEALTNPELIKQYMFGAEAVSDWQKGSSLTYKGVWEGKAYEDKGTILEIESPKLLKTTYFSPLSGLPDKPENYHTVTYKLTPESGGTKLTVVHENNPDQESATKAEGNWEMTFNSIKQMLEK